MKRTLISAVIITMALVFSAQAQAGLNLRGQGTSAHGTYNLIYDTDLDITWYDYTRTYDTWYDQMNWADALSVTFGSNTYTDWRLPSALNSDGSGPCMGENCTGSEWGHLYYTELGNLGRYDTSGNYQPGYGLINKGDFQNLQPITYLSGTEYSADPSYAWYFGPDYGYVYASGNQSLTGKYNYDYAIAVRPGDVAVVPEPVSMILFGVGATVMAARRKLIRRRG